MAAIAYPPSGLVVDSVKMVDTDHDNLVHRWTFDPVSHAGACRRLGCRCGIHLCECVLEIGD